MAKTKLDLEEQELLEAYESGNFESDLDADRRALEEGLPYQSLVSSVLHKYVSGGLKDISANKSGQRTH